MVIPNQKLIRGCFVTFVFGTRKKKISRINVDDLRSKFEVEVFKGLKALQKEYDFTFDYEPESFEYYTYHWYTPDWRISKKDGTTFFIESKGYWRPDERTLLKRVKEQHQDTNIKMLFQNNPKIHKNSASRYSDYCEKNRIDYSISSIPTIWFS
jgi:hypothetical protein